MGAGAFQSSSQHPELPELLKVSRMMGRMGESDGQSLGLDLDPSYIRSFKLTVLVLFFNTDKITVV